MKVINFELGKRILVVRVTFLHLCIVQIHTYEQEYKKSKIKAQATPFALSISNKLEHTCV